MTSGPPIPAVAAFPPIVLLAVAVAAMAVTWGGTFPWVRWLRQRGFGKTIRVDGPDHAAKAGTPTMGGVVLVLAMIAAGIGTSLVAPPGPGRRVVFVATAGAALYGVLGLADDWSGLRSRSAGRERGVGLTARRMLGLQLAGGAVLVALLVGQPIGPLGRFGLHLPWPALHPWLDATWALLVLVATVNAVNVTDGLDGLAAGLSTLAFGTLGLSLAIAPALAGGAGSGGWSAPDARAVAAAALAASGAAAGFLLHNRHPARTFMGNVTSMALGASLALLALGSGAWPLLPLVGGVFAAEILSVAVQVAYFKTTGGRRVLRMAPLHHHFELGGMAEVQVVHRLWLAGAAAGVGAVAIALAHLS